MGFLALPRCGMFENADGSMNEFLFRIFENSFLQALSSWIFTHFQENASLTRPHPLGLIGTFQLIAINKQQTHCTFVCYQKVLFISNEIVRRKKNRFVHDFITNKRMEGSSSLRTLDPQSTEAIAHVVVHRCGCRCSHRLGVLHETDDIRVG